MMSQESSNRRPQIQTQFGRERRKLGGAFQRFCASAGIGSSRSDLTQRAQWSFFKNSRKILSPFWTVCFQEFSENFKSILDSMFRSISMPLMA
jgi:hypothetical protein